MLIPMHVLGEKYGVHPQGILHIGGHIAEEADAYDQAGAKRVIWIEPHPDAYVALERAIKGRPSHRAFQIAASDQDDQEVLLYKASNICSSSLLPMHKHREKHPDVVPCGTVPVRTIRIDTLFKRNNFASADYEVANLDIQGGEMLAFRGMTEYLKAARWIYTEVNTEELYKDCILMPDLTRFLGERGFRLLECKMWSETHGWGDALYGRP